MRIPSSFMKRVRHRSNADTDCSSVGDRGLQYDIEGGEEEEVVETEGGWQVLHKKLVRHFFLQWRAHKLQWPGCQQPVRLGRVQNLMASRSRVAR